MLAPGPEGELSESGRGRGGRELVRDVTTRMEFRCSRDVSICGSERRLGRSRESQGGDYRSAAWEEPRLVREERLKLGGGERTGGGRGAIFVVDGRKLSEFGFCDTEEE